jgi:hypothetical protein
LIDQSDKKKDLPKSPGKETEMQTDDQNINKSTLSLIKKIRSLHNKQANRNFKKQLKH